MDGVSWIKLQTNIFDNRKIVAIENMPEGDAILVVWIKLLTLAGSCNADGFICLTKDIPYTDELLSNQFHKPLTIIRLALDTFEKLGMIEIVNDIICVSNWAKYQNVDGLEKVREQTKKRVQEYRARQRGLMEPELPNEDECNVTCNVTGNADVTQSSISNISISNISNSNNKNNKKKTSLNDILDEFAIHKEVKEALIDFIEMRKAKKRPLTERALKMVINKLRDLSTDKDKQVEIINQSILHNWDTVYELKSNYEKTGATGIRLADVRDSILDDIF